MDPVASPYSRLRYLHSAINCGATSGVLRLSGLFSPSLSLVFWARTCVVVIISTIFLARSFYKSLCNFSHYFLTSLFTELSILSQVQQLYYKAEVSSASNLIKIMKLNVKKIFKAILFNHRVIFHQIDRFVRKIKPVKTPDILDRLPT